MAITTYVTALNKINFLIDIFIDLFTVADFVCAGCVVFVMQLQ